MFACARSLCNQAFQLAAEPSKHKVDGCESLLSIDNVECLDAMMAGSLRYDYRAEEMLLLRKVAVLGRFEDLFLDVLFQFIPILNTPNIATLEERNHITHLT